MNRERSEAVRLDKELDPLLRANQPEAQGELPVHSRPRKVVGEARVEHRAELAAEHPWTAGELEAGQLRSSLVVGKVSAYAKNLPVDRDKLRPLTREEHGARAAVGDLRSRRPEPGFNAGGPEARAWPNLVDAAHDPVADEPAVRLHGEQQRTRWPWQDERLRGERGPADHCGKDDGVGQRREAA
jgi:hypothetical protein